MPVKDTIDGLLTVMSSIGGIIPCQWWLVLLLLPGAGWILFHG